MIDSAKQAELDQAVEALVQLLPRALRRFYGALIREGFDSDQAFQMTYLVLLTTLTKSEPPPA